MSRRFLCFSGLLVAAISHLIPAVHAASSATAFELKTGDSVVFIGDALIERAQYSGWIELMLTTRFPDRAITFRNLGWSADTPGGASRLGLSLLQAGHEPAEEGWAQLSWQIEAAKPTVAFVGYGMTDSFSGAKGLTVFESNYRRLLDALEKTTPGVRIVLLAPIPHEALGSPWVEPKSHNAQLAIYSASIRDLAAERKLRFVPLFDLLRTRRKRATPLTQNGIQLTNDGYRVIAELIEEQLFGASAGSAWRTSPQTEMLRQAILQKDKWFFFRSRPSNMAYIFGFRKKEQGNNASEVLQFDGMIAAEEKRIAQLRGLKSVSVPEIPQRTGNLNHVDPPQPLPEFTVADGFEVTLWAENPLLDKPTQINFDPQGRLWIASSEVYPQIEPGQAATDKIVILEDSNGSGRANQATVFAEGLLIPTGVVPGDGGVYVAQSTQLLHFKDTNGDGKADQQRIVLSGFGTEDTHHNLHTLRWGPDGRLYFNQSTYTRTHAETPSGIVRLAGGGVYRFDPRNDQLDIQYRGWVNAWGHQFDEFGQSFLTDGAGNRGISWAIPGATYQTLAPARQVLQSVSEGNYPKFASLEIIHSSLFPDDWQGDMITADFRAHRIVRFKILDQGAGYTTTAMPDLLRTTADSFRPVDLKFGPDGALYIADWSNPIIQHGEVDFRDPRRDKSHGRIWRVAPKGRVPQPKIDLITLSNFELMDLLLSAEGYRSEQATRVLVERGSRRVLPDLGKWMARPAEQNERAQLRALWIYDAFDEHPPALLQSLLIAKDARIRAAAIRTLPPVGFVEELARLTQDENLRVRVEAVRALGTRHDARAADLALRMVGEKMDPFLNYAVWLTINDLAEPWLQAVKNGEWKIDGRESQLEFGMKAVEPALAGDVLGVLVAKRGIPRDGTGPWIELIGVAGGVKELEFLFDQVLKNDFAGAVLVRALNALADASRFRTLKPATGIEQLATLLNASDDDVRVAAIRLAGAWKAAGLIPPLMEIASDTRRAAERTAAFAALHAIGGPKVIAGLKTITGADSSSSPWREAVITLASLDAKAALPDIVRVLQSTTDDTAAVALWRTLLTIRGLPPLLAKELPQVDLPVNVARAGLRPVREGTKFQVLVPVLLAKARLAVTAQLSAAELQAVAADALTKGDAARGEHIFRRSELSCLTCHAIGGAGGKLGPDLTSIGASAPADYLVESVFYPNAKIKEGYHSISIATKDGRDLSGMVASENDTEVVLRDAADTLASVPLSAIASRTSIGSLMPAGLIDGLLPDERLDLFKFLSQLGKPGDYDASADGVARVWSTYTVTAANEAIGMQRVTAGDGSLADWVPTFSFVNGTLPASALNAANREAASVRGLFLATRFTSIGGGNVTLHFRGSAKNAWLNGKPVKVDPTFTVQAAAGPNILVLQLDQGRPLEAAQLSSADVSFSLQ